MNVSIKRLSADATTPTYAHSTDACFDLYAAADVIIEPGETALVPTGLAFEIPAGYEMVTSVIDCRECYGRGWGCILCDSSGIEYEFGCLSEVCSTSLYGEDGG